MTLTTVYVHGNGNKIAPAALKLVWDEALFGRDMGADTRMAYWAPLRYPEPLPAEGGLLDEIEQIPDGAFEAVAQEPESPEAFVAAILAEVAPSQPSAFEDRASGDPGAAVLEDWLRRMTYAADALAEGESAQPPPASPFEALPLPRKMRIAAFRALVKRTFKDVHAYFFGGLKDAIGEVLRDELRDLDGPSVVVGHSLGSIIAYDVLREPAFADLDLELFMTVGSPLGITEVQDLVTRPLEVPAAAAAWRNVCDGFDIVALDKTLRSEYSPTALVTDFLVRNTSANHHGIREYLCSAPVRDPIRELAGR
jgi:hypothetical protein